MDTASGSDSSAGMINMMARSPFTVSQWQELEHQALIFKYMLAGVPVPPDLVLPIQKSFESISHRFFTHHPNMGYCSYFGKKVDPEPGRCRRTDGKKWRCAKDAYPDSKYCERHMHRGRNRSRKPVESHTMTQSASSMTPMTAAASSGGGNISFQNLPLHAFGNVQATSPRTSQSQYQVNTIPYAIPSKDYRHLQGLKNEVGEHSFFSQASASNKSLEIDSALDSGWPLAPTTMSSFQPSKSCESSILQNEYPQHSFYSGEFASGEAAKQDCQPLRHFFNEWPKTRDNWSGLDERPDQTSFSTTQLSMSIPMTPDFSAGNSESPHGED